MFNSSIKILKSKNKIPVKSIALFLAIIIILLPLRFTDAGSWDAFTTRLPSTILFSIIYSIGQAASYISLTFLGWAGGLFNYVLSPDFNALSLTNSYFVKQGWTITRNFANMIFMLIMLIISFSIILRIDIGGINVKKILPKLIFVAFFINFSRIIAGIIIDAGQIVMVTFTDGVAPEGSLAMFLYNHMKAGSMFAAPGYLETVSNGYAEELTAIATMFFSAVFPFIAALAFFILAVILVLRIVILWILVILAPLAWLAYILPSTETYWRQWWSWFMQYTFFGAAIGFFMYLSAQMASNLSAYEQFTKQVNNNINTSSSFLADTSNLLQYLAIIIMLYASIIAAKKTNSMGVSIAFRVLETAKQKTYQWGVKRPLATSGIAGGVAAKIQDWRENTAIGKFFAPTAKTIEEREQTWAARLGVKGVKEAQEAKEIKEFREKLEYTASSDTLKGIMASKKGAEAKAAAILLSERGEINNQADFNSALDLLGQKEAKTGKFIPTARSENLLRMVGEKRLDLVLNYKAEQKAKEEKITLEDAFQKIWKDSRITMDKIAQQKLNFVMDKNIKNQLIKNGLERRDVMQVQRSLDNDMKKELLDIVYEAQKYNNQETFEGSAGI